MHVVQLETLDVSGIACADESPRTMPRPLESSPARQPCIISSLPCMLDVMKMTSAPKLSHVSLRSFMVSGRPPCFFESQRIILSGSICWRISPVIVGPKVFS